MSTFHVTKNGLEEIRVGDFLTVNGERRRVTRLRVEPADEDDPHLGIKKGDLVTTLELAEAEETGER